MRFFRPLVFACVVTTGAVGATAGWRVHSMPAQAAMDAACQRADHSEVRVPAGTFHMGAGADADEGIAVHQVTVPVFSIDRYAVTNADFAAFVAATGYVTDAEKKPSADDYPEIPVDALAAGGAVFASPATQPDMQDETQWWNFVPGADWRHPEGPSSSIKGKEHHPVVQVSYNDALAYAHWRGRALPTEEQFEFAARGGLDGETYPWGNDLAPGGKHMANTWQGTFPSQNAGGDGFTGTAPVGCFPANGYGLYDMVGNVWQWTQSTARDQTVQGAARTIRVIKGGSFLCSADFCHRYRPAARQFQESSFSSMHIGFRTVKQ